MSDFDIETARQAGQGLKQFMGMSDAELEEHISFEFNRRLLAHHEEMAQAKIIAEVTETRYCSAGCKVGHKLVLNRMLKKSSPQPSDYLISLSFGGLI
jgi:hypothetical protein